MMGAGTFADSLCGPAWGTRGLPEKGEAIGADFRWFDGMGQLSWVSGSPVGKAAVGRAAVGGDRRPVELEGTGRERARTGLRPKQRALCAVSGAERRPVLHASIINESHT